ncbi:GNAT family N-acetyltransferase [Sporosarcina obsidiansis]|uniref:GNAT family N-acetyltransferase n=1 Tax=Sporosarcina obsidiansis TaxID=2660748 RepID=UPI00129BAE1A|nr:GNAT family N-acetyltransferase [Sporosarcina obsidiansis]
MIRQMTLDDIRDVQYIALTSCCHTFQDYIPTEVLEAFIDRSYSDLMLRKQLEKTTILIAMDPQMLPVGYLSHTPIDEDGECEVTALHVLPSHQQSGYEEMLLSAALDKLRDAQQIDVYLDNRADELGNFYVDQGFLLVESFQELFEGLPVETIHYSLPVKQPVYM